MAAPRAASGSAAFASESSWPFSLRSSQLASCQEFLGEHTGGSRVLRVFGESGVGKSFLARELLVRAAKDDPKAMGIYLDVPPAELEASALLARVDDLLSERRVASRDAPSFVSTKVARAWLAAKRGRSARRLTYLYLIARDLISQIPIVGPFIKALLPPSTRARSSGESSASLNFLMNRSRTRPVWLVIDNTQFLPIALRETLAASFADAGSHLRLILIERVNGPRVDWNPSLPNAERMDLDLSAASLEEVTALVAEILPDAADSDELAATLFRRSGGNLKSVWYQLRLVTSRREDQAELSGSYEDVIASLPTLDQAVLRFVVFTVGGMTVASLVALLHASDVRFHPDGVRDAIADLAALGLLVVNGSNSDRVRVEHELVAQVVSEITPEEEKLELRIQAVAALSAVLEVGMDPQEEEVLYDRMLGIVSGDELRNSPLLMSLVVRFIQSQVVLEHYGYLASICRDTVCWDVLDDLPEVTVRTLLDAIQKSSLFDLGLIATTRLRQTANLHESLASLYEAKYLIQLFRYDEALALLSQAPESFERRAALFNISINLTEDDRAAKIATAVHAEVTSGGGNEQDYVVLRNSAHLFDAEQARVLLGAALEGFEGLGLRFGAATTMNNMGIVELTSGSRRAARAHFNDASRELVSLDSLEVYQPLVNLSAASFLDRNFEEASALLAEARDATPRLLVQDKSMLELNAVALDICAGRLDASLGERMSAVVKSARQTKDLRFIDIARWFDETLTAALTGTAPPSIPLQDRIEARRKNGHVPLEVFMPATVHETLLEVPFVLSPNWRY